jgi:hypothetical protein
VRKVLLYRILTGALVTGALLSGHHGLAAEVLDSATFYDRQPGQLFKGVEPADMTVGFVEGQGAPYLTWRGELSGKKVYVELHGATLRIKVNERWVTRRLASAKRLPGEKATYLDAQGTALYAQPDASGKPAVMCLESLLPGASQATLHRSVYVVTGLLTPSPRVFQLPSLYAACKGLTALAGQGGAVEVAAPAWGLHDPQASGGFQIRYHRLGDKGFARTSQTFSAKPAGARLDEFTITQP